MSLRTKMISSLIGIALIVIAIGSGAWWYFFVLSRPNPPLPRASVSVASAASSSSAAAPASTSVPGADQLTINAATFNVEVASTTIEQTRGLSYRTSLGVNDGMLFVFSTGTVQNFWMKDMNFPLDMIWISGNTVVGFTQDTPIPAANTPLWSLPIYSSPPNTDKVLEVNAGTVAKYNIKVGDAVEIGEID